MPPWVVSLSRSATGFFQKRKVRLVICGGVILVAAIIHLLKRDEEPSYMGVKASRWLYSQNYPHPDLPYLETPNAFKGMGQEGALFLGRELQKEPSRFQQWAIAHQQNIPSFLMKLVYNPAKVSHPENILKLLKNMGTNGAPAIPAVIDWYNKQLLPTATISNTNQTAVITTNASPPFTKGNMRIILNGFLVRDAILICGTDDSRATRLLLRMARRQPCQPELPANFSPLSRPAVMNSKNLLENAARDSNPNVQALAKRLLELDMQMPERKRAY